MTTPITHGFRDFGRQTARADVQVFNSLGLNLVALTQTAVVFVGDIPYMYVRMSSTSSTNLGISWFADAAGTVSLFGDVMTTATGGEAIQCIPVRGPYVRFTLERGAYPGTVNFQAFMVPVPFNVYAGTDGENTLISVDGTVIPAGTAVAFDAINTRGGWIHWNAFLDGGTITLQRLYAVDFTGVQHLIAVADNGNAGAGSIAFAPALPLRILINNANVVDLSAFAVVTHHPFYP